MPTKTDRSYVPDSKMSNNMRDMIAMLNKSGKARRNFTGEEWYKLDTLVKSTGKDKMKEQFDVMKRFYAWRWRRKPSEICLWTDNLPTLLNQWGKYVDRAYSFLDQHGDVPGSEPKVSSNIYYMEPNWDWKGYLNSVYVERDWDWEKEPDYIKKEVYEAISRRKVG